MEVWNHSYTKNWSEYSPSIQSFIASPYQVYLWLLLSFQYTVERNTNGTLFESVRCVPCPENTYPSPDGTKCLNCQKKAFKSHVNCPCPLLTHLRIKEYCVSKNGLMEWPDVRSTYVIKYQKQQIDSYYFRTELQLAVYLCKVSRPTSNFNSKRYFNYVYFRVETKRLASIWRICAPWLCTLIPYRVKLLWRNTVLRYGCSTEKARHRLCWTGERLCKSIASTQIAMCVNRRWIH